MCWVSPYCRGDFIASPAGYENVPGEVNNTIPFTWNIPRYQQVFGTSDLTSAIGKQITSISFRVDEDPLYGHSYPGGFAYSSLQIRLSITPRAVDGLTTNLDANVGPSPVTVFDGPYVVPALRYATPVSPFDLRFVFQTPYLYSGGNLLVDFLTPNVNTPLPLMDAVNVVDSVNRAYIDSSGTARAGEDTLGLVARFEFVPEPTGVLLATLACAAIGCFGRIPKG